MADPIMTARLRATNLAAARIIAAISEVTYSRRQLLAKCCHGGLLSQHPLQ